MILVCLLLTITETLCEVPPPYTTRGFKLSSQVSIPQSTYGSPNGSPPKQLPTKYGPPPTNNAEPLDPSFKESSTPIKFTLNNQYRTIKGTFEPVNTPQRLYDVPKRVNSPQKQQVQTQNIPQTIYGAPTTSNLWTQNGFTSKQQIQQLPKVQKQNIFSAVPQTVYGAPTVYNQLTHGGSVTQPQVTYGAPNTPQKQQLLQIQTQNVFNPVPQPQRNYGTPDSTKTTIDTATLEEIRELKQVLQRIEASRLAQQVTNQYAAPQITQQQNQQLDNRFVQHLPTLANNNFRNSLSDQYLPVKEPENFKKFIAPTSQFNPQDSANVNIDNTISFRKEQGRISPNRYIPPNQNNNNNNNNNNQEGSISESTIFGNIPRNSWNNLDLPNVNNVNTQSNNGFSNSVPLTNNVDIQKVEVTQFGPRNRVRNNSASSGTTVKPQIDDLGAGSNEREVNNRYLPPRVENSVRSPRPTTPTPPTSEPDYDDQGAGAETPNIAIATSVAVPQNDLQYYLLQPDGTYQSIILEKGGRQEKAITYGQNYLLQNLRSNPNIAYTPIVNLLGK
ncbi:uncharacterized protein DDB_G0288805-like isoform X2 [Diorhabda carinulata]|uniref:uncharacterized protein DDB_G0288805-like isoform X2 n=1 Tax=Diorhabda carinulata TaxID=1163345 RepID=UPI0025A27012|nr:uncharacterized protein DDB_G0288805-like isoform X2 [Diorhabda carinulata]